MLCYYDDPKPPSPLGWWDCSSAVFKRFAQSADRRRKGRKRTKTRRRTREHFAPKEPNGQLQKHCAARDKEGNHIRVE